MAFAVSSGSTVFAYVFYAAPGGALLYALVAWTQSSAAS
jgi:hypothetical protein